METAEDIEVTVEEINAIGFWCWKTADPTCHICSELHEYPCPTCNVPGDMCPPAIGECGHAFHMHCFQKWISRGRKDDHGSSSSSSKCPLCRQEFVMQAPNNMIIMNVSPSTISDQGAFIGGSLLSNDDSDLVYASDYERQFA